MGTVSVPNLGPDPFTVNASVLNGKVDPLVTEFNGNIENVNVKDGAAIAATKLNLATIAQVMAMSSKELLLAKGADVASGTSITLGTDGNFFDITGTTDIQTITAKQAGSVVFLQFDGALALVDDTGNLELNGANLEVAAEDVVSLVSDGTNWLLLDRSSVRLPVLAAGPATAANTGAIYAKDLSSRAWPYFREESSGSEIALGRVIQIVNTTSSAVVRTTGTGVLDDDAPPLSECPVVAAFNTAITPTDTNNKLKIDVVLMMSMETSSNTVIVALYQDDTDPAIAAVADFKGTVDQPFTVNFSHYMAAGTTSETTFKVGVGVVGASVASINGVDNARKLGGVSASSVTVTEIAA